MTQLEEDQHPVRVLEQIPTNLSSCPEESGERILVKIAAVLGFQGRNYIWSTKHTSVVFGDTQAIAGICVDKTVQKSRGRAQVRRKERRKPSNRYPLVRSF